MNNSFWINNGGKYTLHKNGIQSEKLEIGIYSPEFNEREGYWYLERKMDSYSLDFKVYDLQTEFIERVVRIFQSKKENLGVLLNGLKGSGKSVTAKIIASKINIPIILVKPKQNIEGVEDFVNSINQDIVFFVDEFEKHYSEENFRNLLSIMDGSEGSNYKRLFLFTTNNVRYINVNFFDRPSRIRYLKNFDNLSLEVINEIIDDFLDKRFLPSMREQIISYLKNLNIITIDVVKTIIEEINIFGKGPDSFKDILNIKEANSGLDIYKFDIETSTKGDLLYSGIDTPFDEEIADGTFKEEFQYRTPNITLYSGNKKSLDIIKIISNNIFLVKDEKGKNENEFYVFVEKTKKKSKNYII